MRLATTKTVDRGEATNCAMNQGVIHNASHPARLHSCPNINGNIKGEDIPITNKIGAEYLNRLHIVALVNLVSVPLRKRSGASEI